MVHLTAVYGQQDRVIHGGSLPESGGENPG